MIQYTSLMASPRKVNNMIKEKEYLDFLLKRFKYRKKKI